jgi:hypothetical protein
MIVPAMPAAVATTTTSDITDYRTSYCHRSQSKGGKDEARAQDFLVADLPPTHTTWICASVRGIKMAEARHQLATAYAKHAHHCVADVMPVDGT